MIYSIVKMLICFDSKYFVDWLYIGVLNDPLVLLSLPGAL